MHHPNGSQHPNDEQSWAFRIRAGDARAFEEAFHACYASMCGFVRALTGSHEAAEDIVQNVFQRVWQERRRLRPDGSLRSLLYRSAHNGALNYIKHRNIELKWAQKSAHAANDRTAFNDPAAFNELSGAVDHLLARLPERCRTVFLLSRHHGLTYNEIAETLGISVKTVETQMGRALKALRAGLAAYLP